MVETLVYYRKNGTIVPDKAVANRLADIPAELQTKLANAGLITVTKSKTCQELWDMCMKHRATEVKPKTLKLYRLYQTVFFETFSPSEPIEKVTAEQLLEWKTALLTEYATASVAGIVKVAKMVFEWAVDQDWLIKNPLKKIPNGSFVNRKNDRIISMEEYAKLLDACPKQLQEVLDTDKLVFIDETWTKTNMGACRPLFVFANFNSGKLGKINRSLCNDCRGSAKSADNRE